MTYAIGMAPWSAVATGWVTAFLFATPHGGWRRWLLSLIGYGSVGFPLLRLDLALTSDIVDRIFINLAGPIILIGLLWVAPRVLARIAAKQSRGDQSFEPIHGGRRTAVLVLLAVGLLCNIAGSVILLAPPEGNLPFMNHATFLGRFSTIALSTFVLIPPSIIVLDALVIVVALTGVFRGRPYGETAAQCYGFFMLGFLFTSVVPISLYFVTMGHEIPSRAIPIFLGFAPAIIFALSILAVSRPRRTVPHTAAPSAQI
ncbi:MAG: hypothetical protein HYY84_19020 [Deltaproteobacteria bacterium]|nr:hypothetical protein [Deltaproteobacteria bacterium]